LTPLHEAAFKGFQNTFDALCSFATAEQLAITDALGNTAADYFSIAPSKKPPQDKAAEGKDDRSSLMR
jgi:hypothetical protein